MQTIHAKAKSALSWERTKLQNWEEGNKDRLPEWLFGKICAGKRKAMLRRAAKEGLKVDRFAVSGIRRKDFVDEMAMFCRGLMPLVSVRGEKFHNLARQMRNLYFCWGFDASVTRELPDSDMSGLVGEIRSTGVYREKIDGHDPVAWTAKWAGEFDDAKNKDADYGVCKLIMFALKDGLRMEIGRTHYTSLKKKLLEDGSKNIGGYFADSLMSMLKNPDVRASYEGCSGGEIYTYVRKTLDKSEWEWLLTRAPKGAKTETAIQCFPHEHAKSKACQGAGLFHTLRMNDSIYSGSKEQIDEVWAKING